MIITKDPQTRQPSKFVPIKTKGRRDFLLAHPQRCPGVHTHRPVFGLPLGISSRLRSLHPGLHPLSAIESLCGETPKQTGCLDKITWKVSGKSRCHKLLLGMLRACQLPSYSHRGDLSPERGRPLLPWSLSRRPRSWTISQTRGLNWTT